MAWPFSSGSRLTSPIDGAALGADRLDIERLGMESNTSHTVSARRNSAAGVGVGKGECHAQAVAVAPRLDGGGLVLVAAFGGGLDAAGAAFGGSAELEPAWAPRPSALPCDGAGPAGGARFRGFRRGDSFPARLPSSRPPAARCRWPASLLRAAARGLGHGRRSVAWPGLISILACSAIVSEVGRRNLRRLRRRRFLEGLVAAKSAAAGPGLAGAAGSAAACGSGQQPAFPPAGRRRRSHSSFPRGRNARRPRRSARCRRRKKSTSARWLIEAMFGGAATLASARSKVEHAVELQRQLLVVQHRRDADAVGHLEHEADEGRLHRGADPHRRPLLGRRWPPAARAAPARRPAPARPVRE